MPWIPTSKAPFFSSRTDFYSLEICCNSRFPGPIWIKVGIEEFLRDFSSQQPNSPRKLSPPQGWRKGAKKGRVKREKRPGGESYSQKLTCESWTYMDTYKAAMYGIKLVVHLLRLAVALQDLQVKLFCITYCLALLTNDVKDWKWDILHAKQSKAKQFHWATAFPIQNLSSEEPCT